jgi:hypothetical protein
MTNRYTQIQGPACKTMLDNLHLMLFIPGAKDHKDLLRLAYATFASFREIVGKVFSNDLASNWELLLENFKETYLALGASVTTKVKYKQLINKNRGYICKNQND